MPVKPIFNLTELVLYAFAALSGALGGCAAAGVYILQKKEVIKVAFVLAYGMIGIVTGVTAVAYTSVFILHRIELADVILHGTLAGFVGSTILAGGHASARWALRRLGIEITVSAKKLSKDENKSDVSKS